MKYLSFLFLLFVGACSIKPVLNVGADPADSKAPTSPLADYSSAFGTAPLPLTVEPKSWPEQNRSVAPRGSNLQ